MQYLTGSALFAIRCHFYPQRSFGILTCLNRGFYMSAHVLLNLLNELGKRDKMRGLPSIYLFFATRFYLSYNEYFEISFLA